MISSPGLWSDNLLEAYKRARELKHNKYASLTDKYAVKHQDGTNELFSLYVDAAFNNEATILQ